MCQQHQTKIRHEHQKHHKRVENFAQTKNTKKLGVCRRDLENPRYSNSSGFGGHI